MSSAELLRHQDHTVIVSQPAIAPEPGDVSHALSWFEPGCPPRRIPIGGAPITIGRMPPCDLVLTAKGVSRAHCRLELRGGEVVATDLGSTNGTYVDGRRIAAPTPLQHGANLQIASHAFAYERRTRREIEFAEELDRDLQEGSAYLQSLLPEPIGTGPVRTEWLFLPRAGLGTAGFGAQMLGADAFVAYALQSTGSGLGATMQTAALLDLLARSSLPGVDPREPAAVLDAIAEAERGGCMSAFYAAYDRPTRRLRFAAAGHAPAFLHVPGAASLGACGLSCPALGAAPGHAYRTAEVEAPPGASLWIVNDRLSEWLERRDRSLGQLLPGVLQGAAAPGVPLPLRLHRAVLDATGTDSLPEDFVALIATFV